MDHGNQTFASVIGVQDGMIFGIQFKIKDFEVLLNALGIGRLGQWNSSDFNLYGK